MTWAGKADVIAVLVGIGLGVILYAAITGVMEIGNHFDRLDAGKEGN